LMQPHVIWYPVWALFGFFFVLRRRLLRDQVLHTSRMPRTAANGKNREYDISRYKWALGLIVFHFMNWFVRLLCFVCLKYPFVSIANSSALQSREIAGGRRRSQSPSLRDCLEDLISILQRICCHGRHGFVSTSANPFPSHTTNLVELEPQAGSIQMVLKCIENIIFYPSTWPFWSTSIPQLGQKPIRKPLGTKCELQHSSKYSFCIYTTFQV
jgi:hypothetical protein